MNGLSLSILTLLHYNVQVRDTLEYALDRAQYSVDAFKNRKNAIKIEIEQPTCLKNFIEKNEEIGKKVTDEINALYADVYSEDSTICHLANETELRVDASRHLAIYDLVFPLHNDVKIIIQSHLNFARKNNQLDDQLMQIVAYDEMMYSGVVMLCLYKDLERLFVEYNKARNEAKGEITPQSNFVQNELVELGKHIRSFRERMSSTDIQCWECLDYLVKTLEQTEGRRALLKDVGFKQIFENGRKIINEFVGKIEPIWKEKFEAGIKELVDVSRNNNGKIVVNAQTDNNNGGGNNGNSAMN